MDEKLAFVIKMALLQVAIVTLMMVLQGGLSEEPSDDEWTTCMNDTCHPPFEWCDGDTGRCEALEWTEEHPKGWIGAGIYAENDDTFGIACNEDGDYPGPDCHTFYRCQDDSLFFRTCTSPGYPFFDPVLERCTNSNKCPTFDCINKPNSKVGLKGVLSPFFAYCVLFDRMGYDNTGLKVRSFINTPPMVITRCYGKDTFNPNTGSCEASCLQEGLIPDTTDCHSYYLCTMVNSINPKFEMERYTCSEGDAFDQDLYGCFPENTVSSCNKTYASPV